MAEFLIILVLIGIVICIMDWRLGMLVCIAVGFLADTARKIIPGEPVYMVIVVGVFFGIVIFSYYTQYGGIQVKNISMWRNNIKVLFGLFFSWLFYQAIISFYIYGSPIIIGISLLSYLAPIPAFLIAYYYGFKVTDINRFMKFYVFFAILMLSGIYLSYIGYDWNVLKEVGAGVKIYVPGKVLDAYPGFLRSTEGAAWHAATAICMLIVLMVSRQTRWPKILVAAIILLLIGAGLLTGRRKMLMTIIIFAGFYWVLLFYFKRGASKIMIILILMTGMVGMNVILKEDKRSTFYVSDEFDPYMQRGATVFEDVGTRSMMGIHAAGWAIYRFGVLGGGLGVASQGAQHFGGGSGRFGGAGEGGLGKITAELGLPGLFLVFLIFGAILFNTWQNMKKIARYDSPLVPLYYGLVAFLAANIPAFLVATQIFGDLFVLLMLGWTFGLAVSVSDVIVRTSERDVSAIERNPLYFHRRIPGAAR